MQSDHFSQQVSSLIDPLLLPLAPRPVLVDVGASAEVPSVWRPLAKHSIYVGFDPDLREMRQENGRQFHTSFVLNEAVTDKSDRQVTFRLTRVPQCSSTLRPNRAVLTNYLRPDRFDIERETTVPATTLNEAISRVSLAGIDWLKLDTQGTDLRLFNSIADPIRERVLAVDAEPGLRGAYEEEDLFGDLHMSVVRQGFWCAAATIKGLPRVRQATLAALADWEPQRWRDAQVDETANALPVCPGWVECRYLRTVESLADGDFSRRDYVLLWAFALAAGQPGFAGDVAVQYSHRFANDDNWHKMLAAAAAQLKCLAALQSAKRNSSRGVMRAIKRIIRNKLR